MLYTSVHVRMFLVFVTYSDCVHVRSLCLSKVLKSFVRAEWGDLIGVDPLAPHRRNQSTGSKEILQLALKIVFQNWREGMKGIDFSKASRD